MYDFIIENYILLLLNQWFYFIYVNYFIRRRNYGELLDEDPYVDGYTRKYDGSSYREQDFYDRSGNSLSAARRPYSSLYDRPSSSAVPMRDDYV